MFRRLFPLIAAGVLAACGGAGDPAAAPATATAPTAAPSTASIGAAVTTAPTAAVAIPAALDFSAPLVGGGEIELGSLAGRPVLLWFWAPW